MLLTCRLGLLRELVMLRREPERSEMPPRLVRDAFALRPILRVRLVLDCVVCPETLLRSFLLRGPKLFWLASKLF